MTKSNAKLKVVASLEDELRELFNERKRVAALLRAIETEIADAGRQLAQKRGVAFIRIEHLKSEFGPPSSQGETDNG